MNTLIILVALYIFAYTVKLARRAFKEGNKFGGIAVALLAVAILASSYMLIINVR